MLDVHPPEHAAHSWRDFAIHIATIVIGLLIAVGLEQSVEFFHHRHQRHQMLEDIREEGESNARICSDMLFFSEAESQLMDAWAGAVRSAPVVNGYVRVTVSPDLRGKDSERMNRLHLASKGPTLPTVPVWDSARDNQTTALLPEQSVRFFAQLPYMISWIDYYARNSIDDAREQNAITLGITGGPLLWGGLDIPTQETVLLREEQRERLLEALEKYRLAYAGWRSQMRYFGSLSSAIAEGVRTDKELKEWEKTHHR